MKGGFLSFTSHNCLVTSGKIQSLKNVNSLKYSFSINQQRLLQSPNLFLLLDLVCFSLYRTWIWQPCYIKKCSPERVVWLSNACGVGGYHRCSLHSNYRSFITKLHSTLPFCGGCIFADGSLDHTEWTRTRGIISVRRLRYYSSPYVGSASYFLNTSRAV